MTTTIVDGLLRQPNQSGTPNGIVCDGCGAKHIWPRSDARYALQKLRDEGWTINGDFDFDAETYCPKCSKA